MKTMKKVKRNMEIKELQDAMDKKQPIYYLQMKEYEVKKLDLDPNNPSNKIKDPIMVRNGNSRIPLTYTMPTAVKVIVNSIDELNNRANCSWPIWGLGSPYTEVIDYGNISLGSLYMTQEEAESKITFDLVSRFLNQDFIDKYPQVYAKHSILSDIFMPPKDPEEDEELIED